MTGETEFGVERRRRIDAGVLTLNEEVNTARCLPSVKGWAEELVVAPENEGRP